jgi:hypothetical protein
VTYPVAATTTSILASNVQEVTGVPLFRYYAWNTAANPLPDMLLPTPLSVVNAPRSVKIAMSFRVLPDRAFNTNRPTATFEDVAYSRLADPAKPDIGPFCG